MSYFARNQKPRNLWCQVNYFLRGEGDRKFVTGVVRAPGIVEDDFHGATTPGAAEINTLIAVVGPGGNYLPVPMSLCPRTNSNYKLLMINYKL